jgi:hypothetical protein
VKTCLYAIEAINTKRYGKHSTTLTGIEHGMQFFFFFMIYKQLYIHTLYSFNREYDVFACSVLEIDNAKFI